MIFKVHMLAFMNGEIRNVNVPDNEVEAVIGDRQGSLLDGADVVNQLLEKIFYYGQNDFQPLPDRCSVSMGDVAEINGMLFICQAAGWKQLSKEQLDEYLQIPQRDRSFSEFVRPS